MVVAMLTGEVWSTLSEHLGRATLRRIAVRGLGRGSAKLLHVTVGDLVLFDGSRQALENGTTRWGDVGRLLRSGARLVSVPGLDTSALLLDIDGRPHAVVGAPAATRDAAERGSGTAVLTDGPTAVRSLAEQMAVWEASGTVVDEKWVRKARDHGRKPRRRPAVFRPVEAVAPAHDSETWVLDASTGRLGPSRPLLAGGRTVRTWTPAERLGTERPPVGATVVLSRGTERPQLATVLRSASHHLVLGEAAGTDPVAGPSGRGAAAPREGTGNRAAELVAHAGAALFPVSDEERAELLAAFAIVDPRRHDPLRFYPSMADRPGTPHGD